MGKKLILHVPHASTNIPDAAGFVVSSEALKREVLLLNDWYTDDLFTYPDGTPIVADFNRVFCDVERFAEDVKEIMSDVGMGAVYTKCDDGNDLRNVSSELKSEILSKYYYPHHERLRAAVAEQLSNNDSALIVDCHSFGNMPFKRDIDKLTPRPDICIGVDSFHTPRSLYKFSAVYFKFAGYNVKVNTPYSGSIVPLDYYQKENRVHSIMIEVNRNLYLVPGTNKKSKDYNKVKSVIRNYLHKISCLDYNYNSEPLTKISTKSDNDITYSTEFNI
jgi:N-formylglutamate deformylase